MMLPVTPHITVRPLTARDALPLLGLLNDSLLAASYSALFDLPLIEAQVFTAEPSTLYPTRWGERRPLGAFRAGHLVGFLDAAIGFDQENLDRPFYQPIGLLRYLALPARADLMQEVGSKLLDAADTWWREKGVGYIKAFARSTGYPQVQGGAGMLPAAWAAHVQLLTARDYHLVERYQFLCRMLSQPIEEYYPWPELSLIQAQTEDGHAYRLYRRIDPVGEAHVTHLTPHHSTILYPPDIEQKPVYPAPTRHNPRTPEDAPMRVAYLAIMEIQQDWRGRDIGKMLLRRIINDATLQGFEQLIVHLSPHQDVAWSLCIQQGFQELNYRGYVLDRMLG